MDDVNDNDDTQMTPRRARMQELAPWLELLMSEGIKYKLAHDGCVDSLVTVDVASDVADFPSGAEPLDPNDLRKLREAIDLFYMVLVLDPGMLWSPAIPEARALERSDALAARTLERGGAFELRIEVDARGVENAALLEPQLLQYFIQSLDHKASADSEYVHVRNRLLRELEVSHRGWRQRLDANPVTLRFTIQTPSEDEILPIIQDQHLRSIVDFIIVADSIGAARVAPANLDPNDCHVPVVVDRVTFSLELFRITQQTLQLVQPFKTVRKGFAICDDVRLDPQTVHCAADDVTQFLDAVAVASDHDIGVSTGPYHAECIDGNGRHRSDVCEAIVRGLAHCRSVQRVYLGGMTRLCRARESRRGMYRAMIEHLLTRATPCDLFFDRGAFTAVDAQVLREEHATWRRQHPTQKLRVRKLHIGSLTLHNAFIRTVIDVLDEVEDLSLYNFEDQPPLLPDTTVPTLLTKFAGLRALDIGQVRIPSMAILLEPRQVPLEKLRLFDFRVPTADDLRIFLRSLGDPASHIGRTLRELSIEDHEYGAGVYQLDADDAELLAQALQTNNVLQKCAVMFFIPTDRSVELRDRVVETSGRIVPAKLHGCQAVAETARRVALRSLIQAYIGTSSVLGQLDDPIVKEIVAFAAPAVERSIHFYFRDPDEQDDSDG